MKRLSANLHRQIQRLLSGASAAGSVLRRGTQTRGRAAVLIAFGIALLIFGIWRMGQGGGFPRLAPFFAPSVRHWAGELDRWAGEFGVDRDLLATAMQIESCGHPGAVSPSGAQGLFQVMPYHFDAGEDMQDPETNARRGAAYLSYCFEAADSVIGTALACYNGGPGVLGQRREDWSDEVGHYFRWGAGIYSDARDGGGESATLDRWLAAGGSLLCESARRALRD